MNGLNSFTRRNALKIPVIGLAAAMFIASGTFSPVAADKAVAPDTAVERVHHRTIEIQDVDVAYREAGDPDKPTLVLLHGFPTSSHMFRNLIPVIGEKFHVLAPDYPGFGDSAMPALGEFDYSFANYSQIVDEFLQKKNVNSYFLYVMDYGAPVGYRLFARSPEKVRGFVIQNGNAYEEGLEKFWDPIKVLWADRSRKHEDALRPFLELAGTKWQYVHGVSDPSLVSPDNWVHDQYLLDRPGNKDIQIELFHDYRTNVGEYAKWQALFREFQPPALLVWGQNDEIFPASGAHPYKRDLKDIDFHLLDAGHFALETHGDFIARKILAFMGRKSAN